MSEEKFTPGPWVADWKNNPTFFPFVWQKNGYAVAKMCGKPNSQLENTTIPAACLSDFTEPEKVLANAALIAAAPEMYYALEHYFDLIQRADCGDIVAEQKIFEDICYIEGALMKARGEEE